MKPLPMSERAANTLRKLSAVTGKVCAERCAPLIPDAPARCCDPLFCGIVEKGLLYSGQEVPDKPGLHGVPFLGERGCVVDPALRPGCAGYVCPDAIRKDRAITRQVKALRARYKQDPRARALEVAGDAAGVLERLIGRSL